MLRQVFNYFRYPFYSQKDLSDCGIEALRMVLAFHKLAHDKARVDARFELDDFGTNFLAIQNAANELGLDCIAAKVALAEMSHLPLPVIIHWNNHHFIVVYEIRERSVLVADPASGMREISIAEFAENCFNGDNLQVPKANVLIFEKNNHVKQKKQAHLKTTSMIGVKTWVSALTTTISVTYILLSLLAFTCSGMMPGHDMLLLGGAIILFFLSVIFIKSFSYGKNIYSGQNLSSDILQYAEKSESIDYQVDKIINAFYLGQYLKVNKPLAIIAWSVVAGIMLFGFAHSGLIGASFFALALLYFLVLKGYTKHFENKELNRVANAEAMHRQLLNYMHKSAEFRKVGKRNTDGLTVDAGITPESFTRPEKHSWLTGLFLLSGFVLLFRSYHYSEIGFCRLIWLAATFVMMILAIDYTNTFHWINRKWFRLQFGNSNATDAGAKLYATGVTADLRTDVSVQNISCHYPSRNFDSGLVNIHFFIPAGSKLAIIGRQGSGKSTLIKLMTGQIKPDSGLLTIGGIRMEDIGTEQFLDITGICTNNSELLEGTVEWNITLEKETKNNKRLKDVIDATMLNNFIINVEDGIKLFVEPSRNNISDSIRRKILLARLLYQNKPLIFIDLEDQFTDPIENLTLFESVMDYCHDKTVVYTTKNTDVAGLASQIVLLENGEQLMVKTGAEYLKMNERNELTTTDQENRH